MKATHALKDILNDAVAQGWTVSTTNKSQWRLMSPDGKSIVIFAGTPSDHRAFKNFIGHMRRGGFKSRKDRACRILGAAGGLPKT